MKRVFQLLVFKPKRKTSKTLLLNYYFLFLNIQKKFKNQLITFEVEFHNFVILLSFTLTTFNIFNIILNPLIFNWQTKQLYQTNINTFFKNLENQLLTECYKYSDRSYLINKSILRLKKSQVLNFGISSLNNSFLFTYYNRLYTYQLLPTRINSINHKQLNFIDVSGYSPLKLSSINQLILSSKKLSLLKYKPSLIPNKTTKFQYIYTISKKWNLSSLYYSASDDILIPEFDSSIDTYFQIYNKPNKIKYTKGGIHYSSKQSNLLWIINPYDFLMQFFSLNDSFESEYESFSIKSYLLSSTKLIESTFNILNSDPSLLSNQVISTKYYIKKSNLFNLTKNCHDSNTLNNLYWSINSFLDVRESFSLFSISVIIQLGFIVSLSRVFQNLYKDFGKEILTIFIDFIKIIGIIEDEEWVKEDLDLINQRKSFRAIKKVKTRLRNIAGIEHSILEIGEIIWLCRSAKQTILRGPILNFLKNQQKSIQDIVSTIFMNSKAFLFIGPPGTGKTLLVQAIAGESEVPILIQSGSILKNPRQRGKGARMIQKLFQRARQIAPCIVFIDEVDGIGARRSHMSSNINGNYDLLELIENNAFPFFSQLKNVYPKSSQIFEESDTYENLDTSTDSQYKISLQVLQENEFENISRTEQVSLLTQLLIELDGLKSLNHIIVIGATNHFGVLDPALLRPGRFNQFLNLSLPDKLKRMDLFKLYSRKLGFEKEVIWSYFSRRTEGLSSADISAIINESAIHAISNNKKHNIQSLEIGIDRITTTPSRQTYRNIYVENKNFVGGYSHFYKIYNSNKLIFNKSSLNFNLICQNNLQLQLKNSYYSISKNIFSVLFKDMPEIRMISLFTRKPNFRYNLTNNLVNLLENKLIYRMEMENKLIYFLVGKAGELLSTGIPLITTKSYLKDKQPKLIYQLHEQANFDSHDLKQATILSKRMINKWYFYAEQIVTEKYHWISRNMHKYELEVDEIKLLKAIADEIGSQMEYQNLFINRSQKWSYRAWWSQYIHKKFHFVDHSILNWYRIYLADPEENERNIEWVPPDDFYHTENLSQISPTIFWNNFLLYTQDYLYHSLLLNAFNLSFKTIKNFKELIDLLADFLMRYLKIREDLLIYKVKIFLYYRQTEYKSTISLKNWNYHRENQKRKKPTILVPSWGPYSRRKKAKKLWIEKLKQIESEMKDSEKSN